MSSSNTDPQPVDASVIPNSHDVAASKPSRVTMIHRPRKQVLDSRDLPGPGQQSPSHMDKVSKNGAVCLYAESHLPICRSSWFLCLVPYVLVAYLGHTKSVGHTRTFKMP